MEIIWVYLISAFNVLAISISMTFFIVKGYQHFTLDLEKTNALKEASTEAAQVLNEQMNVVLKNFTLSFVFLEISLLLYFTFWNILFYLKIN